MRKQILIIYGAVLGVGLLYYLWGTLTGMFLSCQFYNATGLLCPGCGMSRMFLSLMKFDFVSAFYHNPAMFIIFFYWNIVAVLCFWGRITLVKKSQFLYISLGVSIALFLILGFIRNIY